MRILVTGGAGYLGSVLVGKLLQEGHKVRVLDALMFGGESILPYIYNKNFEFIKGDIRNKKTVFKALNNIECVIHLAALVDVSACNVNAILTKQINYESAILIGKLAKEKGIRRFIFTSTCSNYGISDLNELATEESPLNPLSLYSETKVAAEKGLLELSDSKFSVCILRLSTIFGLSPRINFNLLINQMAREAHVKKRILIYKEDAWRPYTHTDDASDALISILNAEKQKISKQIFNVGTENYQKKALVVLVRKYVPDLIIDKKTGFPDNRDYKVSFEKIKKIIGFIPKRKIADGIDELFWAVKSNMFSNFYDERYTSLLNEKVLDKL